MFFMIQNHKVKDLFDKTADVYRTAYEMFSQVNIEQL